jgi:hypothetical protein
MMLQLEGQLKTEKSTTMMEAPMREIVFVTQLGVREADVRRRRKTTLLRGQPGTRGGAAAGLAVRDKR